METDVKDVYAVGDCAEAPNIITHRPMCAQLGTIAVREGKVAGANAGGDYAQFTGVLASAVTRLFEIEAGATGITETAAARNRIEVVTGAISSKTKADYYPRAKPIKVKLIVEKESQRIIGAQIIGGEEVTQRINALSFAIQKQHDRSGTRESRHSLCAATMRNMGTHGLSRRNGPNETPLSSFFSFLLFLGPFG